MSECSACSDAVWNTQASNGYGTCGQQIAWVRTNIATQQTWEAACSYVALQASTPECAPCHHALPAPPNAPRPPTAPSVCASAPGRTPAVALQGRNVTLNSWPLFIKGVCWSPFAVGRSPNYGHAPQYAAFVVEDAQLMTQAGVNAVRTYGVPDTAVLDTLWENGIYAIPTVFYDSGWGDTVEQTVARVCELKSHPAILMWGILNEPNYAYHGQDLFADAAAAAAAIKAADASRPVMLTWGELPTAAALAALPGVDVWGINVYRGGAGFGNLFDAFAALSDKPMLLSEYGADSYSAPLGREAAEIHALEVSALAQAVAENAAATGGVGLGGMLFEFADEWWKVDVD